jgi:hypothetical protein
MIEGFSEIARALMPYETSDRAWKRDGGLSKPEARGLEWLSEQLANEKCSWRLHEKNGLISTVHGKGADAVVIILNVRGTVKNWSKDHAKHIWIYVLPMWFEDCLGPNEEDWGLVECQLVCVRSPGSPTATDACVSMVMVADNSGVGLSEVKTIREAISNQQQTDKALMDSALLSAKELFLKTGIHPELRKAWGIGDYQGARLAYNAGYYEDARSILRDTSSTLQASNLRRSRRLRCLIRINELGCEIASNPGMPDEIYRKTLEHCMNEDWSACETHLERGQWALRDWYANQKRRAITKEKAMKKMKQALILKTKYPDQLILGELYEKAVGMIEARDWVSALTPLDRVTKLGNRLQWDETLAEACRQAKTVSW